MHKVWQRENDACLRAAVAMVLDRDYRDVPYIPARNNAAFWSEWMSWFVNQRIDIRVFQQTAPDWRPEGPWIAVVPARSGAATPSHAIVMNGKRFYHDPDPGEPRKRTPQRIHFGIELEPNA
jgi:hypothetical protein